MALPPRQNRSRKEKDQGGGRYAALIFLFLIIVTVAGYLMFGPDRSVPPAGSPEAKQEAVKRSAPPDTITSQSVLHNRSTAAPAPAKLPAAEPYPTVPATSIPPQVKPGKGAFLAVIIDDMGTSLQEARSLAGIGVPLTFSIIPGLKSVRDVAAFADSSGIETMIHIPMQSKGWPGRRLETNGLLMTMSEKEIAERVEGFVRSIPKAVGANNHTGSEFTEHEDKMRPVLEVLKGRGLFYVDSVTSPETVGEELARELGMKTGKRQVFLDNEQDEAYIKGQINQAVRLAKRNGAVIAICHPHPVTTKVLAAVLPTLADQGITLVPASRLVR